MTFLRVRDEKLRSSEVLIGLAYVSEHCLDTGWISYRQARVKHGRRARRDLVRLCPFRSYPHVYRTTAAIDGCGPSCIPSINQGTAPRQEAIVWELRLYVSEYSRIFFAFARRETTSY